MRLQVNGKEMPLTVRFLIRLTDTAAGRGNSRVAAMDIGWAQEFLGKRGKLSSIQILLDNPRDTDPMAATLGKLAPGGCHHCRARPAQRAGAADAFQLRAEPGRAFARFAARGDVSDL